MTRKSRIDPEEIFICLKSFEIFDENAKLRGRAHNVWTEAAARVSGVLPETLNFYVRKNRWNLLTKLKDYFGVEDVKNENCFMDSSSSSIEYDVFPPQFNPRSSIGSPPLIFDINLNKEQWNSIKPIQKNYNEKRINGKTYNVLQNGWTDLIAKACFAKTKIPCSFSFKYAKVCEASDSKAYLRVRGSCNECGGDFRAFSLFEPALDDGIDIRVHTVDSTGIPHTYKRSIKGTTRTQSGKELLTKKPRLFRNEAMEELSFGDPEPSYLPRKATLRKIKEEAVNRELGVHANVDPVYSLLQLKYKNTYSGYIQDIGLDRFFVFYSSPMQMTMYKDLIKIFRKIEIDATGSLVRTVQKINGDKIPVFLYQIVVKGHDSIQPVFQVLSEKHDTNTICFWLREIMRNGAPIPPETDYDYSLALLNGVSLAFNDRSLNSYFADCYRWLSLENLQHPLKSFIRVDIAHLIKIICRKNVFSNKLLKVKDFYVRCIGIMSSCESLHDFENLLLSMIIVASSECTGKDSRGNNVPCAEKQAFLMERIKTFSHEENIDYVDREFELLGDASDGQSDLNNHLARIQEEALTSIAGSGETEFQNPFFCPEIVSHAIKLAKQFPFWTNVMKPYFPSSSGVASSARCEAYFKDLKNSDLGTDYKPLRADKFVVKHIKSIESISKIEMVASKVKSQERALKNSVKEYENEFTERMNTETNLIIDVENVHLSHVENWRGLNNFATKRMVGDNLFHIDDNKENIPSLSAASVVLQKKESPLKEAEIE